MPIKVVITIIILFATSLIGWGQDPQTRMDLIKADPNPFYDPTSSHESTNGTVRINNLPNMPANIQIHKANKILCKTFSTKGEPYIDWDLKDEKGNPVLGGLYLVTVNIENFGSATFKLYLVIGAKKESF